MNMANIDWPGLLKWSLKYSDGTSDRPRMSPEDMKFLEAAIKHALSQIEDPNETVKDCLKKISEAKDDRNTIVAALSVIRNCVDEYPEISVNLHKLGAIEPLLEAAESSSSDVAEVALEVFAFALPNNPNVQKAVGEKRGLERLIQKLRDTSGTLMSLQEGSSREAAEVVTDAEALERSCFKCLGAISGLVRHDAKLEKEFVKAEGVQLVCTLLEHGGRKLRVKGATLLRHLLTEECFYPNEIPKFGIVKACIAMLDDHDYYGTGLQYSEVACNLCLTLLQKGRMHLAQTPADRELRQPDRRMMYRPKAPQLVSQADELGEALYLRQVYLQQLQPQKTEDAEDLKHEVTNLEACLKLIRSLPNFSAAKVSSSSP